MIKGNIGAILVCFMALPHPFPLLAQGKFTLNSADLPSGKNWSDKFVLNNYGCTGGNVSPALSWSGAPTETKSFAVMMFDPFTPPDSGAWHWVLYDLPRSTAGLPSGAGSVGNEAELPAGAKQGMPDADVPEAHYYGPCPDKGEPPHAYRITVYALKVEHLDVPKTATAAWVNYMIGLNTLAKASITRPYRR
jgi:Raf kinase inhibitor-like YbhB/YbcL family protein